MPMSQLKLFLEELGFENVTTYIQSGNVILKSKLDAKKTAQKIEAMLPKKFKLDSEVIKVLVLTRKNLQDVINKRPKGFGNDPDKYHSDAIFLIGVDSSKIIRIFKPREGVDKVWPGKGVIYSQRLSSQRTKSRLNIIAMSDFYKSMTIRNWNTTTKLLKILEEVDIN